MKRYHPWDTKKTDADTFAVVALAALPVRDEVWPF